MTVVGTTPASPSDERLSERRRQHEELELRALVERAKEDPDAFAALFRRYVAVVHGFAYRRTGSREVAEEVTSATFERVWRGLAGFSWQGGGFEPWLFRIAATEVAGYFRRRQRAEQPRAQRALRALAADEAGPSVMADPGDLDRLRAAIGDLRPRYQEAISLRYLQGMSHEEAAEAMGCSKTVMAVTLHRATAALRKALTSAGTTAAATTTAGTTHAVAKQEGGR